MNTHITKKWILTLLIYSVSQNLVAAETVPNKQQEKTLPASVASSTSQNSSLSDDKQPIQIQADSLQASEKQGKSVYSGNVEIKQGSLLINGDRIEVKHPNGQLQKVTTIGKPASFKRYNPTENAWVIGQANNIEYDTLKKTVKLSGNAQVEQPGKHLIKGSVLFYDLTKQTLNANSSETKKQRVSVTFSPQNNSQPADVLPEKDTSKQNFEEEPSSQKVNPAAQ